MMKWIVLAVCVSAAAALNCSVCIELSGADKLSDAAKNTSSDWIGTFSEILSTDCAKPAAKVACDSVFDACVKTASAIKVGDDTFNINTRGCAYKNKDAVNWDCATLKNGTLYTASSCTDTYCETDYCNGAGIFGLAATLLAAALARAMF